MELYVKTFFPQNSVQITYEDPKGKCCNFVKCYLDIFCRFDGSRYV